LVEPKQPAAWAAAARDLLEDPEALRRMSERAPSTAARFNDAAHAGEMLALYATAAASEPAKARRSGRLAPRRA